MADQKQMELELVIVPQSGTLRELRQLRLDLYAEMEQALSGEGVKLEQASDSRSLDPAIIAAISVVLLPAVVDKLGDLRSGIFFGVRHKWGLPCLDFGSVILQQKRKTPDGLIKLGG